MQFSHLMRLVLKSILQGFALALLDLNLGDLWRILKYYSRMTLKIYCEHYGANIQRTLSEHSEFNANNHPFAL